MADNEQQELSPEEKLLKVIQGEGDASAGAVDAAMTEVDEGAPVGLTVDKHADTVPRAASRTVQVLEENESKKLSLKKGGSARSGNVKRGDRGGEGKKDSQAAKPAAAEKADGQDDLTGHLIGTETPAIVKQKSQPRRLSVNLISRGLAAVVAIMVLLSALEIFANIKADHRPQTLRSQGYAGQAVDQRPQTTDERQTLEGVDVPLPSIDQLMLAYSSRPILKSTEQDKTDRRQQTADSTQQRDWQTQLKDDLNLLGFSRDVNGKPEVILVDKSENKMHLLQSGQSFVSGGKEFLLERIESQQVVLVYGEETLTIK